ncbi:MAG: biotin/lipoyl-binding protein [Clostridia bacterium]|nr:biotin/lipoyl-binding protein [Clostridia bacterium]
MANKEKIKKPKSKKRKRKIIKLIISLSIAVALVVCGIIFIPRLLNGDEASGTTLQKRTATVIEGDVVKTIGSSAPLNTSESLIYKPESTGDVVELFVEDGDFVSEGDVLIILDTSNTDDSIKALESQIESKYDQIADKEDSVEAKYNAIEDRQDDISDKKEDIADLEDEISELEDEIADNEGNRSNLNIYAPIDGTIFDIKVESGDTVNTNTVFATITNTVSYEVELPFTAKILDEEIMDINVFYRNNKLESEIISIAEYTYKDKFGNEMVDVLIAFNTDIALPSNETVDAIIELEALSYRSTSDEKPYYADSEPISSAVSGEILELYLTEKQSISAGDLVAVIDGDSIDNVTESLNNQIESIEKQIETAIDTIETYYENIDSYYEDIADLNEDIADLMEDIADLEAEIEEEKEGYEKAQIKAEFDGIISGLSVAEGDSVNANTKLFTLVSMNNPSMVVSIDELDIAQLEIGQEAEVVIDALTDTETAPVTAIVTDIAMEGNYVGGVTTYDVTVKLLDPVDGLKLSMNATATIYIDKSENTLYIPIEAITLQGGRSFVYVQDASAAGEPIVNNPSKTDATAIEGQQAAGTARQGGMRPGGANFNPDDMTEEQRAAMEERLASMGVSMDDMQNQASSASESVSDIADYYTGTRLVEVTTGIYNELYIEIIEGLEAGDVVVLPPLYQSDSTDSTEAGSGFIMPGIGGGLAGGTGQRPAGGFGGGNK